MVTFYRKAQIERNSSNKHAANMPNLLHSDQSSETDYLGTIDPDDKLPCVVVRPKTSRKANNKKMLRLRNTWDWF
jgi:hypothetical protein